MAYLTDRKRATGLGSGHSGTGHFWSMTRSSWALAVLVPLFVFTFAPVLGEPHEAVLAWYGRPFPAIVAALTIVVGFLHLKSGFQVMVEDYVHGSMRRVLILGMSGLCYAAAATGLFAVLKIAL
jgi:succinate dehydrogenase / fumarate reductase membrane anchor subunit